MKKGFTLLELMAAVLIGSMAALMIAGSLTVGIRAWTRVQQEVSQNYNRRMVLDLLKRQGSSIFFKRDADALMATPRFSESRNDLRQAPLGRGIEQRREMRRNRGNRAGNNNRRGRMSFDLPDGTHFFRGTPQELSFISTVSFLSDFPGQVGVKYYVVQNESGEDEDMINATSSRNQTQDLGDSSYQGGRENPFAGEVMQGNLYLYVEEKNLFLSQSEEDDTSDLADPTSGVATNANSGSMPQELDPSQVVSTKSMKLIGPLRSFNIRYRKPAIRRAQESDGSDDWAEQWDMEQEGYYPSAIEFILFYEEPGITDDLPDEELPGIRMVIPIYDSRNLARGVTPSALQ